MKSSNVRKSNPRNNNKKRPNKSNNRDKKKRVSPKKVSKLKKGKTIKKTKQRINKKELKKNLDKRVTVISNTASGFKMSIFLYALLIYIFAFTFVMLTFYSKIERLNSEILIAQNKKNELMEEKRYLEIKLNNSYNIVNIKEVAENKLHMKEPEEHQIIYIEIPKETSVVYKNTEPEKSKFDFFN